MEKLPFYFLDFDESARLIAAARGDGPVIHGMVTLALHTGMHLGELRALAWDCVDLDA